jgi:hypothetical protein
MTVAEVGRWDRFRMGSDMNGWGTYFQNIMNAIASVLTVGTLLGVFSYLAAFVAFIWFCLEIYESKTVQGMITMRRYRKIKKLRKQLTHLEAVEEEAKLLEQRLDTMQE